MRRLTLTTLLLLIISVAACASPVTPAGPTAAPTTATPVVRASTLAPVTTPTAGELTVIFKRSGGFAGVNESYSLKPDGRLGTGNGPKQADGGAPAVAPLATGLKSSFGGTVNGHSPVLGI